MAHPVTAQVKHSTDPGQALAFCQCTDLGLQQCRGQDVGTAAGELAAKVPAGHAPCAAVPRPAHDVCIPLRLLCYEVRDVLGLRNTPSGCITGDL